MKKALSTLILIILVGCSDYPAPRPEVFQPVKKISPSEMIMHLKTGYIYSVFTTHSQSINLVLADGKTYQTIWEPPLDSEYSEVTDALNLVIRVLKKERGLKNFSLICE